MSRINDLPLWTRASLRPYAGQSAGDVIMAARKQKACKNRARRKKPRLPGRPPPAQAGIRFSGTGSRPATSHRPASRPAPGQPPLLKDPVCRTPAYRQCDAIASEQLKAIEAGAGG